MIKKDSENAKEKGFSFAFLKRIIEMFYQLIIYRCRGD